MKNNEALSLYHQYVDGLDPNLSKNKKIEYAAASFLKDYDIEANERKKFRLKFKRLLENKPGHKSSATTIQKWEEEVFFEVEVHVPIPIPKETRGRRSSEFI